MICTRALLTHVVDVARRAHVAQHLGDGDGRHLHGVSCVGGHRVVRGAGDDARQAGMPIGAARVVGRVLPIRQQAVNHTASTVAQAPQLPVPGLHADPVPVVVELQRQRVAVVNGLERAHVDEEAAAGEAQQPHHVHGLRIGWKRRLRGSRSFSNGVSRCSDVVLERMVCSGAFRWQRLHVRRVTEISAAPESPLKPRTQAPRAADGPQSGRCCRRRRAPSSSPCARYSAEQGGLSPQRPPAPWTAF
mmetsp:Transcript_17194/g.47188  ORF Transcript_17194/g.47188 Transcript_17194/m.47188 type:complete len:247 (-) Transcript_17194:1318-2058(-)